MLNVFKSLFAFAADIVKKRLKMSALSCFFMILTNPINN
ncbi:hypothetical protein JCM19235_5660 [Vibrio maritimus]|uniref:Uncharacterized protein n=2 Tax=Vibrio TaxID=662 RepID=A0A090RPB9_9VIBR|nr:hypothetical protein JCM19235_5660 [Vibrio maritimus]GAL27614.1 hypothetical protein JCM19239_1036 [Vibrio variabilis]